MDINLMRIAVTVLSLGAFLGIVVWAYSRRRSADFEQAARAPFDGERLEAVAASPSADADHHYQRARQP
ncbi:MAG: cbb3-type cytochrome oxidase subunit 3 [Aquabacterium sp.]